MKTMVQMAAMVFLVGVSTLEAQRGGGRGGERGGGGSAAREFESVKGEYDAWKLAVLNSKALQMPGEEGENFYLFLTTAAHEERLSDKDFAELGQDYIRLVLKNQKAPGSATAEMETLSKRALELANGELNPAAATLEVNQKQIEAQELLWFGVLSKKLSSGKRSTIERKQKALTALEEKAKGDQKISEREREKLTEDAKALVSQLKEALSS